jgi:hypothetical protein
MLVEEQQPSVDQPHPFPDPVAGDEAAVEH